MEEEIRLEMERFSGRFATDESCLKFLERVKWENGFACPKCGHTNYCRGTTLHSRRCTRCKKEVSPTANTLFHHCKIPLSVAFKMAYITCKFPDISSYAMNDLFHIRRMTCYHFQRKVKNCFEDGRHDLFVKALLNSLASGTDGFQSNTVHHAGHDQF